MRNLPEGCGSLDCMAHFGQFGGISTPPRLTSSAGSRSGGVGCAAFVEFDEEVSAQRALAGCHHSLGQSAFATPAWERDRSASAPQVRDKREEALVWL